MIFCSFALSSVARPLKKSSLNDVQKKIGDLIATSGPDHAPNFTIAVRVKGMEEASATASSKRAAQTGAAAALLQRLADLAGADDAKKDADAAKSRFMDGTMVVYQGPLKSNDGKEVIAAGVKQPQTDIALESMNYLVEGVRGKVN